MVAAGAVVTPGKTVKSGQLWAGIPARYARDLREEERGEAAWIVAHYRDLAGHYRERLAGAGAPESGS
jgi:carbonic anhydrase/acetyltransferase-like protein (isoleucine patch superfamily)